MNPPPALLEHLLIGIQQSVSCSSRLMITHSDEHSITLQLGSSGQASVSISIHDPSVPTFSVTYPKLSPHRKGGARVSEQTCSGILPKGVTWIVRKVFRFGFVPPEGYRKDHRSNTAKARRTPR